VKARNKLGRNSPAGPGHRPQRRLPSLHGLQAQDSWRTNRRGALLDDLGFAARRSRRRRPSSTRARTAKSGRMAKPAPARTSPRSTTTDVADAAGANPTWTFEPPRSWMTSKVCGRSSTP